MANVYTLKQLTDAVRQVESGGEKDPTRAINPKSGARGDMQVMPGTLYKPEYGIYIYDTLHIVGIFMDTELLSGNWRNPNMYHGQCNPYFDS